MRIKQITKKAEGRLVIRAELAKRKWLIIPSVEIVDFGVACRRIQISKEEYEQEWFLLADGTKVNEKISRISGLANCILGVGETMSPEEL